MSQSLAFGLVAALFATVAVPQGPAATDPIPRLPRSTVAVLETGDAPDLAQRALALIQALPDPPQRLQGLLTLLPIGVRAATGGVDLEPALRAMAADRAVLALVLRGAAPEPLFVATTGDDQEARELRARMLARLGGRGFVDDGDGRVIVAASRATLELAQRAWTGEAEQLGQAAWIERGGDTGARLALHVDFAAVRARDPDRRSYWDRLDPAGRLLLGPLAAALDGARALNAELVLGERGVSLRAAIDGSPLAADAALDALAARLLASPREARVLPPAPLGTFVTLALDRSLRAPFVHVRELFGEAAEAQLRGGLSIANTLLGASLVDTLLPSLGATWTFFAVAQPPLDQETRAGLDLPGFAVVVPLVDAARAESMLRRGLGAFALAANAERLRNNRLTYTLRMARDDQDRLSLVFEPQEWHGATPAPVDVTLTPTLVFARTHLVFASTRETAYAAVAALDAGPADEGRHGDRSRVDPRGVAEYLARNEGLAVLDAVLKRGIGAQQARRELDDVIQVLRGLAPAEIALVHEVGRTTLTIALALRDATGGTHR